MDKTEIANRLRAMADELDREHVAATVMPGSRWLSEIPWADVIRGDVVNVEGATHPVCHVERSTALGYTGMLRVTVDGVTGPTWSFHVEPSHTVLVRFPRHTEEAAA